jgi:Flp pilus assembly pilin Flp
MEEIAMFALSQVGRALLALVRPLSRERGEALAEYSLVLALVTVVGVVAVVALGAAIVTNLGFVAGSLT